MAEELRALHDRMGATTVYVTHDQLEAMQMGDMIVVMNHGIIEQFGAPQDIYDKPATMFVADFIGSRSMNFLRFAACVEAGATGVTMYKQDFSIPETREPFDGDMVFGVRPEHVHLNDGGTFRATVTASEYLGTTQIITLDSEGGTLKARIAWDQVAKVGENVGLSFGARTITLFDNQSGRALRSDLNEGVLSNG